MIKNIIFDFGDIFINLDKQAVFREMERFGAKPEPTPELIGLSEIYEVGGISSDEFINQLTLVFPKAKPKDVIGSWNSILLDFPEYRLQFLEELAQENTHRLFLLSNTNAMHIERVIEIMGIDKFDRFKNCFEKFYLSHEINLRKPNADIYQFVLDQNELIAEETIFVDDTKENTDAAEKLNIKCWHLQVGKEDIVHLKNSIRLNLPGRQAGT